MFPERCQTPTPQNLSPEKVAYHHNGDINEATDNLNKSPTQSALIPKLALENEITTDADTDSSCSEETTELVQKYPQDLLVPDEEIILTEPTDYIFLCVTDESDINAVSRDGCFFRVDFKHKENGRHSFLVFFCADNLTEVCHLGVSPHTMIMLLNQWLASSHVKLFSINGKIQYWAKDSLATLHNVLWKHYARITGFSLNGSVESPFYYMAAVGSTRNALSPTTLECESNDSSLGIIPHAPRGNGLELYVNLNALYFGVVLTDDNCVALLRHCHYIPLQDIIFQQVVRGPPPEGSESSLASPIKPLELTHLKSLQIKIADFDTTIILDHFTCPALSALSLTVAPTTMSSVRRLDEFLACRVSEEPLELLNIFDYSMRTHVAIPLLHAMMNRTWGTTHKKYIETFGIFSGSLPKDLLRGFSTAWNAWKSGNQGLVEALFVKHRDLNRGLVRPLSRIGWGKAPAMYQYEWA